jgi:hypothetical protein
MEYLNRWRVGELNPEGRGVNTTLRNIPKKLDDRRF